jgi:type IV secretory pathway VirB2 component (pilin)
MLRFGLDLSPGEANCSDQTACDTGLPVVGAGHDQLQQILQIAFGIIAALAVLMIVIAGFRFAASGSNPQEAAKARETIVYAIVGLLVAITAEAIVTFVLRKL